jgi:hypothetical protein
MATIHAFFSPAAALIHGSAVYRKHSGSRVNVTRMSAEREVTGLFHHSEKYLGEVIAAEEGGCVVATAMVDGVTTHIMRGNTRRHAQNEAGKRTGEAINQWENEGGHG